MKKKTIKNYIAFTLTEMTMVLLIMSILAAVSAPIVKHAVSDVVNTSEAEPTESGPWKKLTNLAGIFYSSVGNGIVSIGTIPGGAPNNYNYPAMIIQSNGAEVVSSVSQIAFVDDTNYPQRLALDKYNNIALGSEVGSKNPETPLPYSKILIGRDISNSFSTTLPSSQSISIGANIMRSCNDSHARSILLGNEIGPSVCSSETPNYDDSINIGYNVLSSSSRHALKSINIGSYAGYASMDNYSNLNVGTYAGANGLRNFYTTSIGSFAGDMELSSSRGFAQFGYSNVNLGRYAGFVNKTASDYSDSSISNFQGTVRYLQYNWCTNSICSYIRPFGESYSILGNVNIGQFAGSFTTKPYIDAAQDEKIFVRRDNVAIGLGALASTWKYDSVTPVDRVGLTCNYTDSLATCTSNKAFVSTLHLASNIAIGPFAGNNLYGKAHGNARVSDENLILIGAYAGAQSMPFYYIGGARANSVSTNPANILPGTIAIGPFAGYRMGRSRGSGLSDGDGVGQEPQGSIMIGYYAGYSNKIPSIIAIGNYAGSTTNEDTTFNGISTDDQTSIYIGDFAGYKAKKNAIGIGRYACANVEANSMCFGNFPYSKMNGNYSLGNAWAAKGSSNTAYFFAGAQYDGQATDLILAAKNIYSVSGTITSVTSDSRSKRKINLVNYGIKDFRKFDIYNFSLKADKSHENHIGVIAQEYRKAFPLGLDKNGKYYSVKSDWLFYSMINAVKDLEKLIQDFQMKFDEYINNFDSIRARIADLEQDIAQEKANNENMRKQLDAINAKLSAQSR